MKKTVNNWHEEIRTREDLPKLINHLKCKKGVEVGVCRGGFSKFLLENTTMKLYSVDPWSEDEKWIKSAFKKCDVRNGEQEKRFQMTTQTLAPFGHRSEIIRERSEDAVGKFEDNYLDFIYLDGSHRFEGFALDLIKWWPKLKDGGIFSGHDYLFKYRYEVMDTLNAFSVQHKQLFYLTAHERESPVYHPSWWMIKTSRNKKEWNVAKARVKPYYLSLVDHMKKKGVIITPPSEILI